VLINDIVQKLNISARAIRFYEQKGLIAPKKHAGNQYRVFTEQEVWRLQTIISLREVGMSLKDIKNALAQIDSGDYDELQHYLDLQRAMMFSQWLELKQMIATTDGLIGMLKQQQSLPLNGIYALAEGSKRLRDLRKNWRDQWDFDGRALTHDAMVSEENKEQHIEYKDYKLALSEVVRAIAAKPGEIGLDLGTGTGNLAGRFLKNGISMCGVDQSKAMLRQCKLKFPELETKLGNFLAIPYLDGKFDFVVSSFAFQHLTDEQKWLSLQEIERVLKPQGRICFADLMYAQDGSMLGHNNPKEEDSKYYGRLEELLVWLDQHHYSTQYKKLNSLLHIISAIKA
jgi:putative AdoMet-dependent methyltransferase